MHDGHPSCQGANPPIHVIYERSHLLQPPPLLRELQADGPVHKVRTAVGDEAWLVTGYEQVRRLVGDDSRLGRSHPDPGNAARSADAALFGRPQGNFDTEQADHARMRALLRPHFSSKRMRALRPRVAELVTQSLDRLEQCEPPVDLNAALARPLPMSVICELLGVPPEDRAHFEALTHAVADTRDPARSHHAAAGLWSYGRQLVARKRREPGDDVISRLCADDSVDTNETAKLSMLLLFAGFQTVVVQIGIGMLLLLTNPGQYKALRDNPGLVAGAIDEILRAQNGRAGGLIRYARTDIEIGGMRIRAGDLVLLDTSAANHDEAVFPDPDRFDVTRRAGSQLAFGHGTYYCIGAPLARIELELVFTELLRRFPGMRLAVDYAELGLHTELLTGGLFELPVTW